MDLLRETARSLRAHPLRFGLTSLGILWGALMLTLLSSNMAGLNQHFKDELEEVGPKVVSVWGGYVTEKRIGERGARQIELEEEDVDRVAALRSIESATPDLILWSQIVRAGRRTKLLSINGGTERTQSIRAFGVAEGRFLTPIDVKRGARVAFLGAAAARRLFGSAPPLGQTLQIESISFRVIGISVAKGDQLIGINGRDDNVVLIPYTTMQRHLIHDEKVEQFIFAPVTREGSFEAVRQTKRLIALHHDFDPNLATAVSAVNIYESLRAIFAMMDGLQLFQVAAGLITLFVGAVGVMNIMLVVVGERTREIGLRKAVGATTRTIFVQFMAEAATISVLSGVLGSVLGIGLSQLLASLMPPGAPASSPPIFDPLTISAVVISLVVVAAVAGVAPAVRAARIPPAQALRAA